MPELPEVETVKRGLEGLIVGKKVGSVDYDWPKGFPNSADDINSFLIGSKVTAVRRRAKVLIIDLDSKYSLVIHLKMTGQLVFRSDDFQFGAGHPNDSLIGKLPDKSTRVILKFSDHSTLFFNDQRKFGWMRLLPTLEIPNIDFFKRVGPEPLEHSFTHKEFIPRARRRAKSSIKAVILDQTVLAGVGNIYADESLWMSKIHPATKAGDVSDAKLKLLLQSIKEVLQLSIDKGGSTDKNYVDAEGRRGSYLEFANVFRREGQACPRCASEIIKIKVATRGTHVCPKCQRV
jgi:formamidopyrimidine-DNA glycosylase